MKTVSIVLPIYNEEANLQKGVLDKVINYAKNKKEIREIIVVDDGSTDKSVAVVKKEYLGKYPKLKLILKEHSGKAFTVIKGIESAKSEYVLFSDIDLATPIEEADKLLAEVNGYEIVIGSRSSKRKDAPLLRKVMALGLIYVRTIFIGLKGIKDTQCGFKLFQKKAALVIINKLKVFKQAKKIHGSSVGAGFDLEFLFIASKVGYQIKEVPVIWRHVETKNVNFIKDSIETMRDILKIRWQELGGKYNR